MSLTKKLRGELLKIRIKAYEISYKSSDLLVINFMNAVVEYADKARREEEPFYAELAKRNWVQGNNRIKEIGEKYDKS